MEDAQETWPARIVRIFGPDATPSAPEAALALAGIGLPAFRASSA